MNGIYLETFAAGIEPDAQQITVLEEIGSQCPYSGGAAVRRARGLLMGRSALEFDDEEACSDPPGQQQRPGNNPGVTIDSVPLFQLYPNPATDGFVLDIRGGRQAERQVRVLDTHGRLFAERLLGENDRRASFVTIGMVSGIYFVRVIEDGKPVHSAKIIVK